MKIDLDHFETLEELEQHLIMWVKEEDPFSFNRYLNQEDVLKIVQMLIRSNFEIERLRNQLQQKDNIIKEVREKINKAITESEIKGNGNLNLSELLSLLDKGE